MITTLYIQGWRLDQDGESSVEVNSSVLDISDITKNTGDYTKTFTVPASKRNNIIFKHWYDANVDNSFDARTKVSGEIHLSGIPFKKGKFRLSKVNVKKGKADSYTINFFGNLVSLKDTIGKDELSDLDFSAYRHKYDSDNVRNGLIIGLFSRDIIYNLLVKKQYYFDSANPNTSNEKTRNISYDGGSDTGVVWNDLRPSIKLIKIIEAIESKYDLVFSRDFFDTTEFKELYMWLNPSADLSAGNGREIINWSFGDNTYIDINGTFEGVYPIQAGRTLRLNAIIDTNPAYNHVPFKVVCTIDDEEHTVTDGIGNVNQDIYLTPNEDTTYNVKWEVVCEQEINYGGYVSQSIKTATGIVVFNANTNAAFRTLESYVDVELQVPKIKIIDFLKGLFNMFKLVVIPQDDGTLYIDTLTSFYSDGNVYDVTKYIDFESHTVNRGQILNEINLKFSEPQTILASQFEKNNGKGYGDSEVVLREDPTDPTSKPLDGDSLTFTLPFEQVVYERLTDLQTNEKTNIQYGAIIDSELEPVNPKPVIFYNLAVGAGGGNIGYLEDDTTRSEIFSSVNTPFHHYGLNDPNYALLFEREFSTYTGFALSKNLYTNHYQDYVQSIFNIKKRNWVYRAILPLHITTNLELNDTLYIKGNYYRIDKYNYNLLTGETTLTLINNFDESIGEPIALQSTVFTDYQAKTDTVQVTNLESSTTILVDNGFGTTWASFTKSNNNLSITLDEFSTTKGDRRSVIIRTTGNSKVADVYVYQTDKGYIPSMDFSDSRNSQNIILTSLI